MRNSRENTGVDSRSNSVSSFGSRFIANVATVVGGQAANIAVAVLSEVCFARLLGPGPRGQISLCLMAIGIGTLIGGLGADIPIVIWAADRSRKMGEVVSAVLTWGVLGCAVAGASWWAVYWQWSPAWLRGVTPSLFRMVLTSVPLAVLFSYLNAFLAGSDRFRDRAAVSIIENASGLAGFLLLTLLLGRTADAAMWGYVVGIAVGLSVAGFLARDALRGSWRVPVIDQRLRKGLFTGLRGQIGNVAAFFNYRLDVFIVNYFLDPVQVGLYALGVAISEALWQIPQAVALALFPRTARTEGTASAQFTCLILRQVFLLSCISGGAVALASPLAVPLLFGERFIPSIHVIWWILPGTIALSMGKVAASHLTARHKPGRNSLFGAIALAVTVALDFLLIPRMGIAGAALASSVAYLANGMLLLIALKKELGVKWAMFFVPSLEEFLRYKSVWGTLVAKTGRAASMAGHSR